MPNKKTVGWGEERTPTEVEQGASVGVPASPQPTQTIPDSWINITLGEAIDYGKTIKVDPSEIKDETWVLELEDIEKDSSRILQRLTFSDRKSKSTKNHFHAGDVLYGKLRPYLNKIVIADTEGVCSTEIIPLTSTDNLDNRYLFYWLKHPAFLTYVTKVGYGVNMPRLGTKDGKTAPFILAPLAEQKQIAAKLDQLLARVERLKTRLDAIPALLKRFRQSVLAAAAVSGRLTEEWREKNSVCEWNKERLSGFEIEIQIGPFGSLLHKSDYISGGIPLVNPMHIAKGKIHPSESMTVSAEKAKELERYRLRKGDIVLGRRGEMGRAAVVGNEELICGTGSLFLRVALDQHEPNFFQMYLSSSETIKYLESGSVGTTMTNLNQKILKNMIVPNVSKEEQTQIVHRVEQLFAFAGQIEQRVKVAQSRVNHLTQSILAKAFRGELTAEWRAQNPHLISGEHSAEALLQRIKAQRESAPAKKRRRRKSPA